jgi:RNA polymerase sigma-70 factor (ECF subfamily)
LEIKLENEQEIINRCQSGDLRSFKIIYQAYWDGLYRVAYRMLGSREDCEDALQLTFIKLYKAIKKFRGESKLSTYTYRILLNVCHDLNRKRNIEKKSEHEEPIFKPQNELQIQLDEAIQSLPIKMRECFILFAVEGFKQDEIAEMLKVTVGTVKAHIFQAKVKLKESLKGALLAT